MGITEEIKVDPEKGARRLIAEYGDRLYDVAFRLCQSEDGARDLVSRTFVRAIERIALFSGGSTIYTWLYAILVNFWRMDLRSRSSEIVSFTDTIPDAPSDRPDPAESLAAKADAQAIRDSVARLPAHYRVVTVFRYFEDRTVPEIAAILKIPEGTVKFRLHKAKKMMRHLLAQTVSASDASKRERKQ